MAHKRAAASNVEFRVVAPHRYLMVFLTRVGLAGYLSIYPSLGEALPPGPSPGPAALRE